VAVAFSAVLPSSTSSRRVRRDAAWSLRHHQDCLPEALSGRADPERGGRHQHSLRDLDGCSSGATAGGPQSAAPLVPAPAPPVYAETGRVASLPRPRGARRQQDTRAVEMAVQAADSDAPPAAPLAELADIDGVLRVDPLTGIAVLTAGTPADAPPVGRIGRLVAGVRRVQDLAGGVRPGDCDLATALVRRAGRPVSPETVEAVTVALWEIIADGDLGAAQARHQAGKRSHGIATLRPLGLTARLLAEQCRALVEQVEAQAAVEVSSISAPPGAHQPPGGGGPDLGAARPRPQRTHPGQSPGRHRRDPGVCLPHPAAPRVGGEGAAAGVGRRGGRRRSALCPRPYPRRHRIHLHAPGRARRGPGAPVPLSPRRRVVPDPRGGGGARGWGRGRRRPVT